MHTEMKENRSMDCSCIVVDDQQLHLPWSTFRKIQCFSLYEEIGGGSFRAMDRATCKAVSIKPQKLNESLVREVLYLRRCHDVPSVIKFKEIVLGNDDSDCCVYLVTELAQGGSLSSIVWDKSREIHRMCACKIMYQLLQGVVHLHRKGIIHNNLNTENLLLTITGRLKIANLGLSRSYRPSPPIRCIKPVLGTICYRAPELLLEEEEEEESFYTEFTPAIDIWSAGCIMGELALRERLFPGDTVEEMRSIIFSTLTSLDELRDILPLRYFLSDVGLDLLYKMLDLDPSCRITAEKALQHPWFDQLRQHDDHNDSWSISDLSDLLDPILTFNPYNWD